VDPKTKEKYCRNHIQGDSTEYTFVPADHTFTKFDAEMLQDVGMATVNGDEYEIDKELIGGHYTYPAYAQKIRKRLPTNPHLFLIMRSCTNVQVCKFLPCGGFCVAFGGFSIFEFLPFQRCDTRFLFSYVIKYSCGTEEKSEAKLLHTADKDVVEVVEMEQKHLKISSQKFLHDQERKKNSAPLISEISQPEIDFVLLGFTYVKTTCDFIHVPTMEAADRTTMIKTGRGQGRNLDRTHNKRALECRSHFDAIGGRFRRRNFTGNQVVTIRDFDTGQYAMDKVHAFNVRPPELMVINSLVDYSEWCHAVPFHVKGTEYKLPEELAESPLLDGGFRQVKFVSSSLRDVREYLVLADAKIRAWKRQGRVGPPPFPASYLLPMVFHENSLAIL
jgi:hypothetical protein